MGKGQRGGKNLGNATAARQHIAGYSGPPKTADHRKDKTIGWGRICENKAVSFPYHPVSIVRGETAEHGRSIGKGSSQSDWGRFGGGRGVKKNSPREGTLLGKGG